LIDGSYLQSGDGSSQISATINAPENNYAYYSAHALVKGELHIFGGYYDGYYGGYYDGYKVLFCLTSQNDEIRKKFNY
jgi:hypothetical protein